MQAILNYHSELKLLTKKFIKDYDYSKFKPEEISYYKNLKLLTKNNTKTLKSLKKNYLTSILHLIPSSYINSFNLFDEEKTETEIETEAEVGGNKVDRLEAELERNKIERDKAEKPEKAETKFNICPYASNGCKQSCLNTAGRGAFSTTQLSRAKRTFLFLKHRELFLNKIILEIISKYESALKNDLNYCIRLNGTSDLMWEKIRVKNLNSTIIDLFPYLQFYDYTKIPNRITPPNYYLVFSRSESNEVLVDKELNITSLTKKEEKKEEDNHLVLDKEDKISTLDKKNKEEKKIKEDTEKKDFLINKKLKPKPVAVVFKELNKKLDNKEKYKDLIIINGDKSDLRFLDKQIFNLDFDKNYIVGLSAKGKAKKDTSGFVIS